MASVKTKSCLVYSPRKPRSELPKRRITFNSSVRVYSISPVKNTEPYVDPFESYAQQEFLRLTNRLRNRLQLPDSDEELSPERVEKSEKTKNKCHDDINTTGKKPSNEVKVMEKTRRPVDSTDPPAEPTVPDANASPKPKKKVVRKVKVVKKKKKVMKKEESEEELSCEEIT